MAFANTQRISDQHQSQTMNIYGVICILGIFAALNANATIAGIEYASTIDSALSIAVNCKATVLVTNEYQTEAASHIL
jgi:hypothetical protein